MKDPLAKARLAVAAEAAKTVLEFLDYPDTWLSPEAQSELQRLAERAPKPVKALYELDSMP